MLMFEIIDLSGCILDNTVYGCIESWHPDAVDKTKPPCKALMLKISATENVNYRFSTFAYNHQNGTPNIPYFDQGFAFYYKLPNVTTNL